MNQPTTLTHGQILRIDDVAKLLGFSKSHIYRLVKLNKVPFHKKHGTLFFLAHEIVAWISE